jgi:hypothetical protein
VNELFFGMSGQEGFTGPRMAPLIARIGSFIPGVSSPAGISLMQAVHPSNVYAVRRRTGTRRRLLISRAEEIRTLILIVVLGVVPLMGAVFVISATIRPDLSDLTPIRNKAGSYSILGWSSLLRDHSHALEAESTLFRGAAVQALGYMVDEDRAVGEGEWVRHFVLLPEAGNLFDPAHRFGDQMIEVHLQPDARVRFSSKTLVWVWGTLQASPGDPGGEKPLYTVEQARARSADKGEIREYFK